MKTISFRSFINQLDNASAVVVDRREVTFHQIDEDEDEDGLFVAVETHQTGFEWFLSRDNKKILITGDGLALVKNHNGRKTTIQLLVHKSFE